MNNYDYDRGGQARVNGISSNGGYNGQHYRDDYGREDMRRDDDDRYRRGIRNGFNSDYLDQNSLSDFRSNEPKFELDHLATFAAGTRNGVIHAEDGLRKLRQMENTTGIWTMRCALVVERNYIIILDNSTGEELEKFPIQLIQDPTAVFKNDRREIYNNLILFTVIDDPKKRSSQADMHIFQSSKAPAQEIVDEILAAKNGQQKLYPGGGPRIPPPPVGPAPEPPSNTYDFQGMREFIDSRQYQVNNTTTDVRRFNQFNQTSYSQGGQFGGPIGQQRSLITRINTVRERESLEGGSTEILERDVQLLNHCFDDIEKFVARLQQAAESYKELEKRKRDRGAKNKKKQSGDGMLNARARPPPDRDFVDIFQKFKLSFNLLAKLKAHIHDPNAPELVHFLFTPLSLIYEASRDPYHGNQNLGDQAVAPVLTVDAKQLLLNCLTSKEIELWQALGKHWTTSRDAWQGYIPPYVPEFYDGWQPAAAVLDELASRTGVMSQPAIMAAPLSMIEPARTLPMIEDKPRGYNALHRPMDFPDEDRPLIDRYHRPDDFERNTRTEIPNAVDRNRLPSGVSRQEENNAFFEELRRLDVVIYEAAHDRIGKNSKELTVQKGDILQVLDNSKNWWKLRNCKDQVGFAPYTILKPMKSESYN
uniref:SH3 domain-containing protein n=1 Tax=Arion vulgaris TaxID=1028688 RepID=A0A0B7BBK8_9EUPU